MLNRGSKEATNIDLIAQFSEGIEPTSASGHGSEIVPGQVIFKPIASIPAGGQITVKVLATAQKAGQSAVPRRIVVRRTGDEARVGGNHTLLRHAATDNPAPQSAERSADEPTPARR